MRTRYWIYDDDGNDKEDIYAYIYMYVYIIYIKMY